MQNLSRRVVFFSVSALLAAGFLVSGFALRASLSNKVSDKLATPPPVMREFRAAWVATVANIDWPSNPGLPTGTQQKELLRILDKAAKLHLNAIVLQVRPACDSLYASQIEPWSEYLTGENGKAPNPAWDPLEFAVEEAHKRGIELHAWFNPYRASHPSMKTKLCAGHICCTRPALAKSYGKHRWLDPGEPDVQTYCKKVILDVVKRYDVDGIHIDDYFYPYKEKGSNGQEIEFPDDPSWKRYRSGGGKLTRPDWRRENVNTFVRTLYQSIKAEKRWVKFGISPFGIPRPGDPPQIKGFDQYSEIYADSKKWWINGWCDYLSPQLYWKIDPPAQSYPVLLKKWAESNIMGRHLWPGNYTSRVSPDNGGWAASEIVNQVVRTRKQAGATGNVHFSMKSLLQDWAGVGSSLLRGPYAEQALIPASPWLSEEPPAVPAVEAENDVDTNDLVVSWRPRSREKPFQWVVQTMRNGEWQTQILPGQIQSLRLRGVDGQVDQVSVSAVDRCGNQSKPAGIQPVSASTLSR
jgi:uncharacterized lipoprotein YddW (UPF0748 family)